MKIGIFGGSFDPIHSGHAMLANYMAQWTDLDEVWLMVSPRNPLKPEGMVASEEQRLDMARLVAGKCRGVVASDFEFSLPRPSYTYLSLCRLREAYPQHQFSLIIGSDNWKIFSSWRNPDRIINEFGVLIYQRPGQEVDEELPAGVRLVADAPQQLISSTFIRKSIKENKNLNFFLPPEVFEYIRKNHLYE